MIFITFLWHLIQLQQSRWPRLEWLWHSQGLYELCGSSCGLQWWRWLPWQHWQCKFFVLMSVEQIQINCCCLQQNGHPWVQLLQQQPWEQWKEWMKSSFWNSENRIIIKTWKIYLKHILTTLNMCLIWILSTKELNWICNTENLKQKKKD